MSRHVSYRGVTLDMESLRRENESVPAAGNMRVNAKGDEIRGGKVVRTAAEIARASHNKQTSVVSSGLKGSMPQAQVPVLDAPKKPAAPAPVVAKPKETELPNGDIVIDKDTK
jgi:hypothetical protein